MSASIFDSWTSNCPSNYLDYHENDKKFSELQIGDVVYYHGFNTDNPGSILEIVIKTAGIKKKDDTAYISVIPVNFNKYNTVSKLIFGPVSAGQDFVSGGILKSYNFSKIAESSLCISLNGNCVFGTNRERVLEIAQQHIISRITEVNTEIGNLNNKLNKLNNNLKGLI